MKLKSVKRYVPLMVTAALFVSLFVFFVVMSSPPEIVTQLSPRHTSYLEEYGKPTGYSEPYVSRRGDLHNVRINGMPGVSEPRIIANRIKRGVFTVVSNDFFCKGTASVFVTEDGGMSWKQSQIPLSLIPGGIYYSDPWADYDGKGNLAYVTVAMRSNEYSSASGVDRQVERSVVLNVSRDNGSTWLKNPVTIKTFESENVKFDKPKVRFDENNVLYVLWLEENREGAKVSLCISRDGGRTFGDVTSIAEGDINFADLAFGDDGVYLVYSDTEGRVYVSESADEGSRWDVPVLAAEYLPYGSFLEGQPVVKLSGGKGVRVNSDPQAVISGGKMFIVYAAQSGEGDFSSVYFVRGDLSSMEFSEPKAIGGETGRDKFLPALSKDEKGNVHVIYYTSQNDRENLLTEVYLASTGDLGDAFTYRNLSTESFNPLEIVVDGSYMGDYISLAVNGGRLVAVWTDGRKESMDLMAGVLPIGN